LPNYEAVMWSDVVAERGTEISAIMLDFLRQTDLPPARPTELAGRLAFPQHRDRSFPIASAALTLDVATV
jgi:hypothetical protein